MHPEMAEELRPNLIHAIFYGLTGEDKKSAGVVAVLHEDSQYYAMGESLKDDRVQQIVRVIKTEGSVLLVNGSDRRMI